MDWREHIVSTPDVRSGRARVKGTRITVGDVLDYLAGGMTIEEMVEDLPGLTPESIRACLAFAAETTRSVVHA